MIGRHEGICVTKSDERPMLRALNQSNFGFQHNHAGAFRANQRSRHVKSILGQQLIQVIAGNTPGDFRVARSDQVGVLVSQGPQLGVNRAATPPLDNYGIELVLVSGGSHRNLGAVVEENAQFFDIVDGFSGEQRMRAAGIIPDHPSERAAAMGGRIGTEGEMVFLGFISQRVQDDAGLNSGESPVRVDLQDLVHVLGEVQDHRDIAALPGQTRAGPSRQDRSAVFPARGHRGDHILFVTRNDKTDGNLAVVRAVRRIQGAAATIEAHFTFHHSLQFVLQLGCLRERVDRFSMRAERQGSQSLHDVL